MAKLNASKKEKAVVAKGAADGLEQALRWLFISWDARSRLQTLSISSPKLKDVVDALQSSLKGKKGVLSNLSSLILAPGKSDNFQNIDVDLFPTLFPGVQQLWLNPFYSVDQLHKLPMSMASNLTSLHIRQFIDLQYAWRGIWSNFPQLVSAWVFVSAGEDWGPVFNEPIIVHQNLERLVLELGFPRLHTLDIHIVEPSEDELEPACHAPMVKENVFPNLQNLRIHRLCFLFPSLEWREITPLLILAGSQSIVSLTVSLSPKQLTHFFNFFQETDKKGVYRFPRLRSLCLEVNPSSGLTAKKMTPRNSVVNGICSMVRIMRRSNHPTPSPLQQSAVAVVVKVKSKPMPKDDGLFPEERRVLHDYFSKLRPTLEGNSNSGVRIEFVDLYNAGYGWRRDVSREEGDFMTSFFD
ncbi:hypothetical protein CVT24_008801 [Panaeolus cyanescens]|uniref:Uncharacterized protein n=1 Tax=Panaeolus cyanescens TaxID=181874 RepID=A0A409VB50_9AGAR|nr:hypothetical protein CVT24_008801 [Panaeolus cyanescens]